MKIKVALPNFSFHDMFIEDIRIEEEKMIIKINEGYLFENETTYTLSKPSLILNGVKNDIGINKADLQTLVQEIIKEFDPNVEFSENIDNEHSDWNPYEYIIEIIFFNDGKYKEVLLDEFLKFKFEIVNEAYGSSNIHFGGKATNNINLEEWYNCYIDIYFNGDLELEYDSKEELSVEL